MNVTEDLQNFYDAVTWLLSQAPSARLNEGASEGYHYAMQAVISVREDLRQRGVVTHDESHWKAMDATWRDIATAPQDGTWFLAWDADNGAYTYRDGPGLVAGEDPEPTHWMPLPSAPNEGRAR